MSVETALTAAFIALLSVVVVETVGNSLVILKIFYTSTNIPNHYIDAGILLENTPLVKFIRSCIRDLSGVFSTSITSISRFFTAFCVWLGVCLYTKKKITRQLEDMNFKLSWQEQYLKAGFHMIADDRDRKSQIAGDRKETCFHIIRTIARDCCIHFGQRKCQNYTRVVLAGRSPQTTCRTSRRKFCASKFISSFSP